MESCYFPHMTRVSPDSLIQPVAPAPVPRERSEASLAMSIVGWVILFTPIEEAAAAMLLWKVASGRKKKRRR